jgi:hypothetical protein
MKKYFVMKRRFNLTLILNIIIIGCATNLNNIVQASELEKFPIILLNVQNGNVISYFDNKIVQNPLSIDAARIFNDNIIYKFNETYNLFGRENTVNYYVMVFDFEKTINDTENIRSGDVIGRGNEPKLLIFCESLDPFLVINCATEPIYYEGYYWFDGLFLVGARRNWFSFEQVGNFENILNNNVRQSTEEARGVSLFRMFRYSFRNSLNEFPRIMTTDERQRVMAHENMLFGRNVTTHINEIQIGQYRIILCWQSGFDQHLRRQYSLNNDIWFYSMSMAFNQFDNTVYLFLIDFKLETLEDMYEDRMITINPRILMQ